MRQQEPEKHRPGSTAHARRRKAFVLGLRAESLAVFLLRLKDFSILARRYLGAGGEIDIIAARGSTIIFVEVKARPSIEEAMTSITVEKSRRMSRGTRHWLARNQRAAAKTWRGDVIFLAPWQMPRHAPNFIELDIS